MRTRIQRRDKTIPTGAVLVLRSGRDFFGGKLDNDVDEMRDLWQLPEVREAVYREYRRKGFLGVPFGEVAFGPDGEANPLLTADDLPAIREQYREQRVTARTSTVLDR